MIPYFRLQFDKAFSRLDGVSAKLQAAEKAVGCLAVETCRGEIPTTPSGILTGAFGCVGGQSTLIVTQEIGTHSSVGGQTVPFQPQVILFVVIEETVTSVANSSTSYQLRILIICNTRVLRQQVKFRSFPPTAELFRPIRGSTYFFRPPYNNLVIHLLVLSYPCLILYILLLIFDINMLSVHSRDCPTFQGKGFYGNCVLSSAS